MFRMTSNAVRWASAFMIAVVLAGCSAQRIRDDAAEELSEGHYEAAYAKLQKGMQEYPDNPVLKSGLVRVRNEALTRLLNEAAAAKAGGRLDDTEKALQRALPFDSGERRVAGLLSDLRIERRQVKALADANALVEKKAIGEALLLINESLKDNPRNADLRGLQRILEVKVRQAQTEASQRGLEETRRISLDFRDASLRTVLDLVSRNSGINFVIDKDVRSDVMVSVYLRNARVEDAIDLITSTNQLAKKLVDERTILIYPNTTEKQREHQEQVVKVFYLASADAKGAAAFLRAMLRLKEPFVDERTNMVAIRESQENVTLAERLMVLYDSHDPEVLLEVEVIEVRANRLLEMGVKFPETMSLTVLPPAGSSILTLGNLSSVGKDAIAVGIGSVLFNLRREVGDFNTLANPSIRVRNREKAKILIGDKVPVITSTVGTGGFASDSVNYVEVGLKLDVEPTVFADDDVAIKVGLEASTLAREVRTNSGTLAYQIGTRNANTVLRLRDGETQLLAGLISREDRMSASRLPGVGDLPVLGRLFSSQRDESVRTELVLAITPRVLRNVRHPDAAETEMWIGTEAAQRLRPLRGLLAAQDTTSAGAQPSGTVGGAVLGPRDRPVANEPAAPSATLQWTGPSEMKVGETAVITLRADNRVPLRGISLNFGAGKPLEIVKIEEGELFRQGGAQASLTQSRDDATGRWNVGVLRSDLSGAVGLGTVVQVHVKAASPGNGQLSVYTFDPYAARGPSPTKAIPPAFNIKVR